VLCSQSYGNKVTLRVSSFRKKLVRDCQSFSYLYPNINTWLLSAVVCCNHAIGCHQETLTELSVYVNTNTAKNLILRHTSTWVFRFFTISNAQHTL